MKSFRFINYSKLLDEFSFGIVDFKMIQCELIIFDYIIKKKTISSFINSTSRTMNLKRLKKKTDKLELKLLFKTLTNASHVTGT
jgi:hypothetical protein